MDRRSVTRSHGQPQATSNEANTADKSNEKPADTIVKLREGSGLPLIVMHGGYGSIHAFTPLKHKFTSRLWAIQVTPETPLHSLPAQANYYYRAIKAEQPEGPYRICAFSASSIIAVAVVKLLESNGNTVDRLTFIDHFPTTFIAPIVGVDISRIPLSDPRARQEFLDASVKNLTEMTRRDRKGMDAKRRKMADDLQAAYQGLPTSPFMMQSKMVMDRFLNQIFDFIISLYQDSIREGNTDHHGMGFMEDWLRTINAPISAYFATYGMLGSYKPDNYPPAEWNIHRSYPNAKITVLNAGHYDILGNDGLIKGLQEGYYSTARL